jgi:hypothetical protein
VGARPRVGGPPSICADFSEFVVSESKDRGTRRTFEVARTAREARARPEGAS